MARWGVRTHSGLDRGCILAAERYDPRRQSEASGPSLREWVVEIRNLVRAHSASAPRLPIADTTHARGGFLAGVPWVETATMKGPKKRAQPGDVVISRLRPYLRQVAWVDDILGDEVLLSAEFYVLRGQREEDISWLAAWLLTPGVQEHLAAAQEGGHHPRVPRDALLDLRVPEAVLARRAAIGAAVREAIAERRRADRRLEAAVAQAGEES